RVPPRASSDLAEQVGADEPRADPRAEQARADARNGADDAGVLLDQRPVEIEERDAHELRAEPTTKTTRWLKLFLARLVSEPQILPTRCHEASSPCSAPPPPPRSRAAKSGIRSARVVRIGARVEPVALAGPRTAEAARHSRGGLLHFTRVDAGTSAPRRL